jgi:3-hydroxybutyrate dehydrogenase
VVTGANRGIGRAIAEVLVAAGAQVSLLVRDADAGAHVARALGARAMMVRAEVTDASSVHRAVSEAEQRFGPVSMAVANAGAAESAAFAKTDAAMWQRMLDVNLMGVVHLAQATVPAMRAAGRGRFIAMASTAGVMGYPYVTAYAAAKHAVVGFVRALAREIGPPAGVTVNAVCPGFTDTDLVASSVARIVAATGRSPDEARATLAAGNPQGRLVSPTEVADTVRWLCTLAGGAVHGQAVRVDGGEGA